MDNEQTLQPSIKQVRIDEVKSYESNIDTYRKLIAKLDGDWDADLIHLKDLDPQEAARQCAMDRLDRLAVLQQYDQMINLLKTEIVECAKAQAILDIL
jgi:hypothetical protein